MSKLTANLKKIYKDNTSITKAKLNTILTKDLGFKGMFDFGRYMRLSKRNNLIVCLKMPQTTYYFIYK